MKSNERKVTFGVAATLAHHREQLERKCTDIERLLAGRKQPLLPEGWTDEDAWQLAGALAKRMAQMKRVQDTVFDETNPYPEDDALLEDIPYYNPYVGPYSDENPYAPPEIPVALWAEVLHYGILAVAGNPDFCFPSHGTFGDLEDLFLRISRSGSGPVPAFGYVFDQLQSVLSEEHFRELETWNFGPVQPRFDPPKDDIEDSRQWNVLRLWKEWNWLSHFPYKDALLQAIAHIKSEETDELSPEAAHFINYEIGMEDGLRQAIDLYLHQNGISGMAEDSYYLTYAMLCRTQRQIKKAMIAP